MSTSVVRAAKRGLHYTPLPGGPSEARLREAVAHTRAAYLAPDFDPKHPPSIQDHLTSQEFAATSIDTTTKCERHAAMGAAARLITARLVTGTGPEARFVKPVAVRGNQLSVDNLRLSLSGTHYAVAGPLYKWRNRHETPLRAFLHRYRSLPDTTATARRTPVSIGTILHGVSMPQEVSGYIAAMRDLLLTDPHAAGLTEPERVAMVHALQPLATSGAARHIKLFRFLPGWREEAERGLELVPRGDSVTVRHTDGSALFREGIGAYEIALDTPVLKCPVHQSSSADEAASPLQGPVYDDLALQTHAAINLAADRGWFAGPHISGQP